MKRILVSFLTLLLLGILPTQAYNFAEKNSDGVTIYYNNLPDGTLEVTNKEYGVAAYKQKAITIPERVNGKTVSRIGYDAFKGCTKLTTISLPETITSIGVVLSWAV